MHTKSIMPDEKKGGNNASGKHTAGGTPSNDAEEGSIIEDGGYGT